MIFTINDNAKGVVTHLLDVIFTLPVDIRLDLERVGFRFRLRQNFFLLPPVFTCLQQGTT